jgi:pimeloyl-ACP methyl ester carboxylesterase
MRQFKISRLKEASFILTLLMHSIVSAGCPDFSIDSGFGADGPYRMVADSFPSPKVRNEFIYTFLPAKDGASPLVILCQRYDNFGPSEYRSLIHNMVSRGYAVIFSPFRRMAFTREQIVNYTMLLDDFELAIKRHQSSFDTTRLGIVGHGFGGGAAPALMKQCVTAKKWGSNGAFMFIMGPWYTFGIDDRGLNNFPPDVKMAVQIYSDDDLNDPRIAAELYQDIAIPDSAKVFLVLSGDHRGKCTLNAHNGFPLDESVDWKKNPAARFGISRILDALAAYAFTGDPAAKAIALGHGAHRCPMGFWPDGMPVREMAAVDSPMLYLPQRYVYVNSWYSIRNPRIDVTPFRKARKLREGHFRQSVRLISSLAGKEIEHAVKAPADSGAMVNPIDSGFGADGRYPFSVDSFANPTSPKDPVWVIMPQRKSPAPLVIFLHGYSGRSPQLYQPFITHLASRGLAIVFPTYPLLPQPDAPKSILDKYHLLYSGTDAAIKQFAGRIDTTRIAIFGHSFGAGAAPAFAYRYLVRRSFGKNGSCLFLAAPWYSFDITPDQMARIPSGTRLCIQVYDDDHVNDHAMAIDLFRHLPCATNEYITLFSDTCEGIFMPANHFVPYGMDHIDGQENSLDFYGLMRPFDAMVAYTLEGDSAAKTIAFGQGSPAQTFMGICDSGRPIRPSLVSADPRPTHPELDYVEAWDKRLNPRRAIK